VGQPRGVTAGALAADGADIVDVGGGLADPMMASTAAAAGAWCVRVHDVLGSLDAVRVAAAWNATSGGEEGGRHAVTGAVAGGMPAP
jgi:dihydropteroate synthase